MKRGYGEAYGKFLQLSAKDDGKAAATDGFLKLMLRAAEHVLQLAMRGIEDGKGRKHRFDCPGKPSRSRRGITRTGTSTAGSTASSP